jgi:hypothetical protein
VRWLYEESGGRKRKRVFGDRGSEPHTSLLCSSPSTPRVHDREAAAEKREREIEEEEEQTR